MTTLKDMRIPSVASIGSTIGCVTLIALGTPGIAYANSATIQASGIMPSACNVEGAQITLSAANIGMNGEILAFGSLYGTATALNFSGQAGANFTLTRPQLTPPAGSASSLVVGRIIVAEAGLTSSSESQYLSAASTDVNASATRLIFSTFASSNAEITAQIGMIDNAEPLLPGQYELTSTITCVDS